MNLTTRSTEEVVSLAKNHCDDATHTQKQSFSVDDHSHASPVAGPFSSTYTERHA
jgi:hypothetical protein